MLSGAYTRQAAVQGAASPQRQHSRLQGSPQPGEPWRRSYTPAPGEQPFLEDEDDDWGPPARSVVGTGGRQKLEYGSSVMVGGGHLWHGCCAVTRPQIKEGAVAERGMGKGLGAHITTGEQYGCAR